MNRLPIALLLLLTACSQPALRSNDTETFVPTVFADGTKIFVYHLVTPAGAGMTRRLEFRDPQAGNDSQMQPYSADAERRQIRQRVLQRVDTRVRDSGFCREGYLVLEENIGLSESSLRGECREAATEEDRRRFDQSAQ